MDETEVSRIVTEVAVARRLAEMVLVLSCNYTLLVFYWIVNTVHVTFTCVQFTLHCLL